MAKFILCQVEDMDACLEVPLRLYRNALAARPVGHVDRPSTLIQLAAVHLSRFKKRMDEIEGARAEVLLHEAMEFSSTEGHEKRAAAFMLQLHAGRRMGAVKADGQLPLQQGSPSSLTEKDSCICGVQWLHRFERFGDVTDLQWAITRLEEAVRSTSVWDNRYRRGLANLGVGLSYRFNHLGELRDLERAISTLTDAVDLTPHGDPQKPGHLNNLGNSFKARFERLGELSDLERAISTIRDAVHLTPHADPRKLTRLSNLGNSFFTRFERLGELRDLDDAISRHGDAVDFTPNDHPHKPTLLNNFGSSLITRFKRLGELSDIERAVSTLRDAVDLTPHGHPQKHYHLNNLGNSFFLRFGRLGESSDLECAISTLKNAVDLTPHGHPHKPGYLNNLGNSFVTRFKRFGELNDLECAISTHRDAVDLTPHGHPHMPTFLSNFGESLITHFKCRGELSDLERAISMFRDAVALVPHSHPLRPGHLGNLGNCFKARFERLGELSDVEDAISRHRDAVELTPHGHPDKPIHLNNLGTSFEARFEHLGELSDLEDAISTLKAAVDLTPRGHPEKPSHLNSLGSSFKARFERLRQLSDLERAISTQRDAVDIIPHGHPLKPILLNNFGNSLISRFRRLGELNDLERAISTLRDAVDLTPHGHPDKPTFLHNLGNFFNTRFERLRELSDLERAISTQRDAVDLTPHGHLQKPRYLNNLGNSFTARFERLGEPNDLEQAISMYLHAASAPVGPVRVRFLASQNWISWACRIHHHSLLRAYSIAINLLPELAWIGLSLTHRYSELRRGADVVREAAAAALDSGLPETAVEWLEQGRSIVWGELFQLRSSYEELLSAHPDHARRLRALSVALEHASATREEKSFALLGQGGSSVDHVTESLQQEAARHHTLAIERDKLLQEIRGFPGFEHFLRPKEFSQLRASAHSGPVVILNAAESHCDALIVLADVDHVIHVPLSTFTFQRSTRLHNMLGELLGHARVICCDDREGKAATRGRVSWEPLLSTLWNSVVKPVLDALAFSVRYVMSLEFIPDLVLEQTHRHLSRIFWCPTGPFVFLPIHAAGIYDMQHSQPGHKVSDFVISSYVPTLSILELSSNPDMSPSGDLRLLAVRQPPSDGQSRLPGVPTELEHIKAVIGKSPSARTTLLESSVGTVEEVLALMKEADWVHFACHGIQGAESPTESGLCLADQRRLKLRDIIGVSRPRGGLAFLSACETATGDKGLSDEAIHIAAGMLFAGYGGVIGTMWSISDELAPDVARDVYQQLFRNGTRPDYREAARALHGAVGRLRDSGRASFFKWLPFIHVGL